MALRRERFVVSDTQVVGVVRNDSTYERKPKGKSNAGDPVEVHNYSLEITLYDRSESMYIHYDEDKAARDADFEAVAAVIP